MHILHASIFLIYVGASFTFPRLPLDLEQNELEGDVVSFSVVYNGKKFEIQDGLVKPFVAYAAFNNSMNETG